MKYDNTLYWIEMHKKYKESLKGVGISILSERYNIMKYSSEADTITRIMDLIKTEISRENEISVLDIGAGTGYWTQLFYNFISGMGNKPNVFALDISDDALKIIKQKNPDINTIQSDLKTIDVNQFKESFDIVSALYCFHHIISLQDYLKALKFAGKSVKKGGFLLIGDPILSKPYSKFYQTDYYTYEGHSLPRPSYIIDNILIDEGFERIAVRNLVSFVLGGNTESFSKIGFFLQRKIWNFGFFILYRSNTLLRIFQPFVRIIDSFIKKTKYSNGSIIIFYRKS